MLNGLLFLFDPEISISYPPFKINRFLVKLKLLPNFSVFFMQF